MNTVEIIYVDKKNRMGQLMVNGKDVPINFVTTYKENGFDCRTEYVARMANDWNMSNPIDFQAKTVKGLVGQLSRHNYKLVKI